MRLAALALAVLSACAAPERVAPYALAPRPVDPAFLSAVPAGDTHYSNDSLAALLARLVHETEWGGSVPRLLRFEGPIRVSLQGPGADAYAGFLDGFLADLRTRTGIDIAPGPEPAQIEIHMVDGAEFTADSPTAECIFIRARVGWAQYLAEPDRFSGESRIKTESRREATTVFIPQNTPPHQVRSCLIEEVVQSLGPGNDLWGLGFSIFNDDAAHVWPTALDLLLLRVLYQPDLVPGQDRAATTAAARAALRRLNPVGEAALPLPPLGGAERAEWRKLVHRSSRKGLSETEWAAALREAEAEIARVAPQSAEHCHTMSGLGALSDNTAALGWLDRARAVCSVVYGPDDIRLALIDARRGRRLLWLDRPAQALAAFSTALPALMANGQELWVARTLRARAFAQRETKQPEATATWDVAMVWTRYVLGADNPELAELQAEWDAGS